MIQHKNGTVKANSHNSQGSSTERRASSLLTNRTVGVTVRRKFNLGDYESIDLEYALGGELPDDVDAMWAVDDLTDELKSRIYDGVGPEVRERQAIAKESFLTTPKNAQQQILRAYLLELGVDVDALREAMKRGINLRAVVEDFDQEHNSSGRKSNSSGRKSGGTQ